MKKTYKYSSVAILILVISLLLGVSCKSKKVTLVDSGGVLKSKTHNEVIDDILSHELKYNTITTKGSVTLKDKRVTTIFKIIKDEVIQASIRPILGVEVMRVDITPEKIVLIDRLESRYAEVNINDPEISDLVAFNFYNLQALLTNQLFLAGQQDVDQQNYSKFDISTIDDKYILQTEDTNDLNYSFSVDASERILSTLVHSPSKEITLKWDYDQFVEDNNFIYPTNMLANLTIKKKKMTVGVSYSNLDVNTDFNVDTSILSKYKKVDIMDLIGSYMSIK